MDGFSIARGIVEGGKTVSFVPKLAREEVFSLVASSHLLSFPRTLHSPHQTGQPAKQASREGTSAMHACKWYLALTPT
jgi:hypothetical protein